MISGLSTPRLLAALLTITLYLLMCGLIVYRQWRRRQQAARDAAALTPALAGTASWLVCHATQTGNAEQLAWQTARMLHTAGVPARIVPLAQLQATDLQQAERALFVVSTYGEGDPPDSAVLFARKLMSSTVALQQLHFGVLALGDREYKHFCGFGRQLDQWLQMQGAQPLFGRVDVDNNSAEALLQWQHHLSHIAGTSDLPDWQAPAYERWQLMARQLLNPGSAGNPCFHLELAHADGVALPHWESGDLIQVPPPAEPARPREYSIASIPADGRIHLLVRQERHPDGTLGLASGWLTDSARIGDSIELRLRTHSNFQLGSNAAQPLILIGNGTGLAGLRSHLKARLQAGQSRNWLLFGERNAAFDHYHRDEMLRWEQQGQLQADWVFSRDQAQREYVQDRLRARADQVREWVQQGAAIYVCGSLEGMAGGVESALNDILGKQGVEQLIEAGRYRRDVY